MKKCIITAIAIFTTTITFSQMNFNLPDGYQTYKDYAGNESRADGDFDGDGINDLAIVCSTKDQSDIVVVYLGGKYLIDNSYYWFPWGGDMYTLEFKNNVLFVGSSSCAGRCYTNLKFKYYSSIKNMKLIGYEDGNLGNYQQEGAYDKNINLNTGEYEIGGVKRKVTTDLITLSNVEKYFDYLNSVGSNYIGK